jgi:hypothetical protein
MATRTKRDRAEAMRQRHHEDWHQLLYDLTTAYAGEDATIELLDECSATSWKPSGCLWPTSSTTSTPTSPR